ncbi:hypothetical protein EC968_009011, partial [Mortierella alpina]
AGLIYYAVAKIKAVMSLEYYVQTVEIPVRNGFTEMPDIFICYLNMDIDIRKFWDDIHEPKLIIRNWTLDRDDSSRPKFRNNPCLPYFGRLMVISLGHETVNRSAIKGFQMVFHSKEPDRSQPKNIDDDAPGPIMVFALPNRDSESSANGAHQLRTHYDEHVLYDRHGIPRNGSELYFQMTPKKTYLRRTDIWGLLGSDSDQPEYSVLVSSALMPLGTPYSALNVVFPTTNLVYRQKFRNDPFGFVGAYVFKKRNKDRLSHDYPALTGNEPREDEGRQGLLAVSDHSAEGSESDKISTIEEGSLATLSKAQQQQQNRHILALESKIDDIEAVLRVYYLDMTLFENIAHHVPWYKKVFRREASPHLNRCVTMDADVSKGLFENERGDK